MMRRGGALYSIAVAGVAAAILAGASLASAQRFGGAGGATRQGEVPDPIYVDTWKPRSAAGIISVKTYDALTSQDWRILNAAGNRVFNVKENGNGVIINNSGGSWLFTKGADISDWDVADDGSNNITFRNDAGGNNTYQAGTGSTHTWKAGAATQATLGPSGLVFGTGTGLSGTNIGFWSDGNSLAGNTTLNGIYQFLYNGTTKFGLYGNASGASSSDIIKHFGSSPTSVETSTPDGASAIGFITNNNVTLANATAKLLSVQNNGTEAIAVLAASKAITTGTGNQNAVQLSTDGSTSYGFGGSGGVPGLYASGAVQLTANANRVAITGGISAGGVTAIKTANYTATSSDSLVLASVNGGAWTLTLPAASAAKGQYLRVKCTDLATSNRLTISRAGSDTIVTGFSTGATSFTTCDSSTYNVVDLMSDGTSVWYTTGGFGKSTSDVTCRAYLSLAYGTVAASSTTRFTAQTCTGASLGDVCEIAVDTALPTGASLYAWGDGSSTVTAQASCVNGASNCVFSAQSTSITCHRKSF